MIQNEPIHSYKKPMPEIISSDSSQKKSKPAPSVKAENLSNQLDEEPGRAGQPSGAGVYLKPQPEVLKQAPPSYVAEDQEDLFEKTSGFKVPKIINVSILAVVLILLLFVFNQFTSLFFQLSKSPTWYRYTGYAFLGLLALLLVYTFFSFLGFMIRLNRFDQKSLSELSDRALTIESSDSMQDAKKQLKDFVTGYEVKRVRFSASDLERLSWAKQQLLESEYGDSLAWLEDYKSSFQEVLDRKANEIVSGYAKKVGWNTAIIPNGFLDSIVVFYMNLQMIKSLSVLYHIRVDRWSSLKLFSMIFIHTFGARQLEEVTETMVEHATEHIFEGASSLFTKKLGSKVSEGVINYYFTNRIGKRCIRSLQPLTK